MNRTSWYLALTLLCVAKTSPYKTIILISTPRSLSTGFLRMMEARGDFTIFNEPGIETFHSRHNQSTFSTDTEESTVTTFEEVNKRLFDAQQKGNVFIKEMFYAAQEYLLNETYLRSPDCHVVFIVRNPHHASISLFKKLSLMLHGDVQKLWQLKSELPYYISYATLYTLYQYVQRTAAHQPYIIVAEELAANPHKVVTEFCRAVGIPMIDRSLSWEKLDQAHENKDIWNDERTASGAHLWYDRAMNSTCFAALPTYAIDADGNPTFEEIVDIELRAAHKWEYYYNFMYYKKFCAQAVVIANKNNI